MAKSKRAELVDRLVTVLGESELPLDGQVQALAETRTRIQRAAAPPAAKKSYAPLTRPNGKVMGKQKREAREE